MFSKVETLKLIIDERKIITEQHFELRNKYRRVEYVHKINNQINI